MRKINTTKYMVWFVFGISFFINGCLFKTGVEGKNWFKYASKYDQAFRKMQADGILDDYNKMRKIEDKFLQTEPPTEDEILFVLKSPDRRLQRVGLVAMYLKPIETDQLLDILFEFLKEQDLEFRWYAAHSLAKFTNFSESKRADLGQKLLETINSRKYKEVAVQEMFLLAKFPSEEAAFMLARQLMKEGKEHKSFRYGAFRALKQMGDSYFTKATEYVNKNGSPEIKEELLEWENLWKMANTPTPKE
ncbi:MAG: hypothetical protein WCZ89_01425 [Phycisphaerae bacterium]